MKLTKKLLSLAMALCMVLTLGVVAFATDGEATTTEYADMSTVTLTKEYKLTNTGTTSPAETFSFSTLTCTGVENAAVGVTKDNAPVPTISNVSFEKGAAGDTAKGIQTITITLPATSGEDAYQGVGVYTYTFTETDGATAGVTYRSNAIILKVTVIEQNGKVRVAAVHTEEEGEQKSSSFDNTYSAGSLEVKKNVTGNMGDHEKEFTVKVTFTAPTGDTVREVITYVDGEETKTIAAGDEGWTDSKEVEITLKHDETVTFANIPYGVTYVVEENDYSGDGYDAAMYDANKTGTISVASVSTTITNNKGATVDTGISLDNIPYVLMLSVVAVGGAALSLKKRTSEK